MRDNLAELLVMKNQTKTTADLYLYGDIVSSWFGVWDELDQYPSAIKNFLEAANGKTIHMHINSGGGNVFAGLAIYNMLKQYSGRVIAYVEGCAASIASVIMLAADEIYLCIGSTVMIHRAMVVLRGAYNAEQLTALAQQLKPIERSILDIYMEHANAGITREQMQEKVNAETWLDATEAVKLFPVHLKEDLQICACDSQYLNHVAKNLNTVAQNQQRKEDVMTLDELKNTHPELVNQILEEGKQTGVIAERLRLQEIEAIAERIEDKQMLLNAKYGEQPVAAKDLLYDYMVKNPVAKEKPKSEPRQNIELVAIQALQSDANATEAIAADAKGGLDMSEADERRAKAELIAKAGIEEEYR